MEGSILGATAPVWRALVVVALSGIAAAACASDRAAPSLPSVFTASQAREGRRTYAAACAACHGSELSGGPAPALIGPAFRRRWTAPGRSASELFQVLRTSMPKLAMESLSPSEYDAVFAFLLERNNWPAGSRAFDGSDTLLQLVRFDRLVSETRPASIAGPGFIRGGRAAVSPDAGPTQDELQRPDPADWPYHTRDYAGTRFSTLRQISRDNVARLAVACVFQVGSGETFQTGPIAYRGVLYATTTRETVAIDGATCRLRWRYTWHPRDDELWPMNRGVALARGYVVRGTADGYLLALDARDGRLLWARHIARPDSGETITMAPLAYRDLVIIGPAGGENNIRGWIGAFRIADGEPVWRFNTVPRGDEPGAQTWANPTGIPQGGGAVWTPIALDAAKGELYVAVTNPSPDLAGHLRPGANLYTNALVALDVETGRLRWFNQLVPNDSHDWDLTQVSPLFRESVGGRERDLVATAGKAGLLTVLDRDTHEPVYEVAVTTRKNAEAPVGATPTRVCPGIHGGVEWNGPAYDPQTHLLYVPAVDWCGTYQVANSVRRVPGVQYLGGTYRSDSAALATGWLTAVDAASGTVRWRYRSAKPLVAGVTATSGGLVLTGELTGDFIALDAATGAKLYRFYTGAGIFGGVVTYAADGRQYVAVASGGGSYNFGVEGAPTLFVFSLPATARR